MFFRLQVLADKSQPLTFLLACNFPGIRDKEGLAEHMKELARRLKEMSVKVVWLSVSDIDTAEDRIHFSQAGFLKLATLVQESLQRSLRDW